MIPDRYERTVRIPVQWIDGQWQSIDRSADSLNEALTRISREFEPSRKSFDGSVFLKVFIVEDSKVVPLDRIRDRQTSGAHSIRQGQGSGVNHGWSSQHRCHVSQRFGTLINNLCRHCNGAAWDRCPLVKCPSLRVPTNCSKA